MDEAIKHHFNKEIKEKTKLTGGITFNTWLLVLSDNHKVVFRTRSDFTTSGGREIIIADILEREKFFYDSVNKNIGHICPEIYVVDGTRKYYEDSFQISEYIEGKGLRFCFRELFDEQTKNDVTYKIGEIAARINSIEIDNNHPYVTNRNSWEDYIAGRLCERLNPLIKFNVITLDEVNKIANNMRNKKAKQTSSYLHLDMRHCNMLYHNGDIFVLDAENCEFGDPLHELAVIDVGRESSDILIKGYKGISNIDTDNELYYYYKMERLGLVLDLCMNEWIKDPNEKQYYLKEFYETKAKIL